jgi:hypothetical protein
LIAAALLVATLGGAGFEGTAVRSPASTPGGADADPRSACAGAGARSAGVPGGDVRGADLEGTAVRSPASTCSDAPAPPPKPATAKAQAPLGTVTRAAAQCGTGALVLFAAAPLAVLCTTGTCLGLPFLLGYFETWTGDRFGTDRAPAVVPIATAYAGAVVSLAAASTVFVVTTVRSEPDPVRLGATAGTAAAGLALTAAMLPLAYALSAVPKDAGDDGSEPPAFFLPR